MASPRSRVPTGVSDAISGSMAGLTFHREVSVNAGPVKPASDAAWPAGAATVVEECGQCIKIAAGSILRQPVEQVCHGSIERPFRRTLWAQSGNLLHFGHPSPSLGKH